jgi:hypothetical protein
VETTYQKDFALCIFINSKPVLSYLYLSVDHRDNRHSNMSEPGRRSAFRCDQHLDRHLAERSKENQEGSDSALSLRAILLRTFVWDDHPHDRG